MNNKLLFATILLSLIASTQTVDWQGYGNMSSSNLTDIWSFINSNALTAFSSSNYAKFSSDLSDHLNTLWHPAWNVITVKTIASSDTVVYGYAFREHWMWYNGFKLLNNVYSFVIWKDYNCQNWGYIGDDYLANDFNTEENSQIVGSKDLNANKDDIWRVAKNFMNNLKSKTIFKDKEFSMVISQDLANTKIYGKVCMVKNYQFYAFIIRNIIIAECNIYKCRFNYSLYAFQLLICHKTTIYQKCAKNENNSKRNTKE